jgi:hypothetical protein
MVKPTIEEMRLSLIETFEKYVEQKIKENKDYSLFADFYNKLINNEVSNKDIISFYNFH